jgi:NADH-quinone oxidoreductase subunit J
MTPLFIASAVVALLTTVLAITRANPVHALLYFVLSLLSMAVTLGAPFAAALEVIVYAGAIMVLFLFVVMMLALDKAAIQRERDWIAGPIWVLPLVLVGLLAAELGRTMLSGGIETAPMSVSPQAVGIKLFTTDLAAVELASMLLLAGLIAAFHLGRRDP